MKGRFRALPAERDRPGRSGCEVRRALENLDASLPPWVLRARTPARRRLNALRKNIAQRGGVWLHLPMPVAMDT